MLKHVPRFLSGCGKQRTTTLSSCIHPALRSGYG
jgi:hypothetical protein